MHAEDAAAAGSPFPLGACALGDAVNFALFAQEASAVSLRLYDLKGALLRSVDLDPHENRTGEVWHVALRGLPAQFAYSYIAANSDGPLFPLIDPYAKQLTTGSDWGKTPFFASSPAEAETRHPKAVYIRSGGFDWQQVRPPQLPFEELVIYEMHVRGLTQHKSSKTRHPGTFLGVIEKIPYLQELGVNAVELLPINFFNECERGDAKNRSGEQLYNYWGYSSVHFFALMNRYSVDWRTVVEEFKTMVRELHRARIGDRADFLDQALLLQSADQPAQVTRIQAEHLAEVGAGQVAA